MAQFRKAVITQAGLALIQKTQLQKIKLEFTKIVTGAGEYTETEELGNLAGLKDPKQEFPFSSVSVIDEQTIKLVSVLSNENLQQAYYMREIGVYASDPDEGEILYSLSVAYPGKADYLPAYDGTAPVTIGLDTYQSVSDADNVEIRADPGAYASAKELKELRETIEQLTVKVATLTRGAVKVGSVDTALDLGDTLFVVDNMMLRNLEAASFSNLVFGDRAPTGALYWADTGGEAEAIKEDGTEDVSITNGKLAVSQEEPDDAAFFAKIES